MHDIKFIRENPEAFTQAMRRRGPFDAHPITSLDQLLRGSITEVEQLKAELNTKSRAFGDFKRQGGEPPAGLFPDIIVCKGRLAHIAGNPNLNPDDVKKQLDAILDALPNLPAADVPDGAGEDENVAIKHWGDPRHDPAAAEHFDIGAPLGLDFESAQAVAGARFVYLRGPMARLNRALGQFMLDAHTLHNGYTEVAPPLLVRDEAMYGTTQLPKFAEDSFRTTDGRWLIPTAEVSLTNLVREKILSEAELPLRFTALTPCFRSEAGAAGKDTRGLIRQHQFDKVELVSITHPDASDAEHERMTVCAEGILEALGLPYRRMLLCTGDMGFAARKTFDLEVWLPGQKRYREISSCSNCGDFQARRMTARYRPQTPKAKPEFVHTLNGSALAVGRTLVAVLENNQNADGSVTVPPALVPYMGGVELLTPSI